MVSTATGANLATKSVTRVDRCISKIGWMLLDFSPTKIIDALNI